MASSLTTTDGINSSEILNSEGYLRSLKIISNLSPYQNFYFCSENMKGLEINDIRMFTLLTGKNGIGKSKILKLIRYRLNSNTNSIKINCDKKIESKLIHFDTNLIDLRGQFFMEENNTWNHNEVNFFEQTNKGRNYYSSCTNFCDIRHILKTIIQNENQLTAFNKVLENASFFNFSYDMSSFYLVLDGQIELNKRNLLDITPEDFNKICFNFEKFDDSFGFEGFSGFVSKEQMNTIQQYPLNNPEIKDALDKGEIKIIEELVFKNKKTGMKIPLSFMTSGELVLLLVLLLRFQDTQNKKILLMLDEPDAFLNPSCVNDFLEGLFYLVNEKRIQIIMITHNSTTVGLVAKKMKSVNNKNTIILVKEEENGKIIAKQQNDNFTEVFTELNSDLICVDLPYKIVFVEGSDSRVYNLYYKHTRISKNVQLIFRPSGQKGDSNRDKVIETVRRTTIQPSNQLLTQDETKLSNLIFGIIDKDYHTEDENTKLKKELGKNLFILERYCKENYIFDPIHIYFSFLDSYKDKKLDEKKVKLNQFLKLSDDPLMKNVKKIDDILKLEDSEIIFQKIISEFYNQIKDEITIKIRDEIPKVNDKINKLTNEIGNIKNIISNISSSNEYRKSNKKQRIETQDNEKLKAQKDQKQKELKYKTQLKDLKIQESIIFKEINEKDECKTCEYNDLNNKIKTINYPRALYDISAKDLLFPLYKKHIFLNEEPNFKEDFILDQINSIGIFIPNDIKNIFLNISKIN